MPFNKLKLSAGKNKLQTGKRHAVYKQKKNKKCFFLNSVESLVESQNNVVLPCILFGLLVVHFSLQISKISTMTYTIQSI